MRTNDNLEMTIMALREALMRYFKGNCLENFTRGGVRLREIAVQPAAHRYQRDQQAARKFTYLCLGDVRLALLSEQPSNITLSKSILYRSPQLIEVRKELLKFMQKYLRGVKISETGRKTTGQRDDSHLLMLAEIHHSTRQDYTSVFWPGDNIDELVNRINVYRSEMPF